jgi:hypothetical protein
MYEQVQLTQEELKLLGRIVHNHSQLYPEDERNNLLVLLNLLQRHYAGDWDSFLNQHQIEE